MLVISISRLLAISCIALMASACSSETPSTPSTDQVSGELPAPTALQEAQFALPMDSFVLNRIELALQEVGGSYLIKDCMAAKGYVWDLVPFTESELSDPTSSPSGMRIFNLAIASEFGYQRPSVYPTSVQAGRQQLNSRALGPAEDDALTTCSHQSFDKTGASQTMAESNQLNGFIGDALAQGLAEEAVKGAEESWRACMSPLGIPDLPDAPQGADTGMPTSWLADKWGMSDAQLDSPGPSTPELEVAIADSKCRDSSGYTHALYLAMWNAESRALASNSSLADDGRRARELYNQMLDTSRAVMAAHGGA